MIRRRVKTNRRQPAYALREVTVKPVVDQIPTRGLDRFWRNARTIASHNPLIYKEWIVGDYVVNGTEPPKSWLSGVS